MCHTFMSYASKEELFTIFHILLEPEFGGNNKANHTCGLAYFKFASMLSLGMSCKFTYASDEVRIGWLCCFGYFGLFQLSATEWEL